MDAIVVDGLRKRYGDVQALDGVTFSVREGEVFGLLGPNGAGKSTTVRVLTTLTRPDEGTATVAGEDAVRHPNRVRRAIGYVPQDSGVDINATGRENLLLQGRVQGLGRSDLRARVDELLGLVEIADAADRVVRGYSGGMRRRLDIALGLVHRPSVLFLDEPTTGLDPEARTALWVEVERLARQENLTILLTTHYLEEADHLAERVAIVSRGRVVVQGRPAELKQGLSGEGVAVELADGHAMQAFQIVRGLGGTQETTLDGQVVRTRVPNGAQAIPTLLSALDMQGIPVASVTTSRPSLDDVYLHYTGRDFASEDRGAAVKAVSNTWWMVGRQSRNLMREPIWIALLLIQPMIWLLLYGQLFSRVPLLRAGTGSYVEFLLPGIVVMNAFFGGTWAGMAMINDLEHHVVERFLATPASRLSITLSQSVRAGMTAMIQAVVILLVGFALGVRVHGGMLGVLVVLVVAALLAIVFAGFSNGIALLVRKEATMIALANFIGLPLMFLSAILIQQSATPHWMQQVSRYNPVNWGVHAARNAVDTGGHWGDVGFDLLLLLALAAVTAAFANWAFRVYQRTL